MYTVYLCMAVAVILVYAIRIRAASRGAKLESPTLSPKFGFVTAIFAGVLGMVLASGLAHKLPQKDFIASTRELTSLHSENKMQGSFFLVSGSFGGVQYLQMRVENPDGSTSHLQIEDNSSVGVKEDPSLHGRGIWNHIVSVPITDSPFAKWCLPDVQGSNPRERFIVPAGSVAHTFEVQ